LRDETGGVRGSLRALTAKCSLLKRKTEHELQVRLESALPLVVRMLGGRIGETSAVVEMYRAGFL
jgi:hypothetical protein